MDGLLRLGNINDVETRARIAGIEHAISNRQGVERVVMSGDRYDQTSQRASPTLDACAELNVEDCGVAVDADRLSKGSKSVKVPREPAPGKPLLVIYGSIGLGSFKVRPPNRLDQRRIAGTDRRNLGP